MEGQITTLRWTNHQETILSTFDAMLSSESLVDVTLVCEEGQYIKAHRIILSACSPYLKDLINVDLNKHPIFFLKDVKYSELKALVQYMYRGEVNIPHEQLPSLLAVAQALQIRGLEDVKTANNSISSDTIILPQHNNVPRAKPPPVVPPPPPIPTQSAPFQPPRAFAHEPAFSMPVSNATVPPPPAPPVPVVVTPSSVPPVPKKSRMKSRPCSSCCICL